MVKLLILAFFIVGVGLVVGLIMQSVEKGSSGKVHNVTVEERANAQETVDGKVVRGRESWNYFYVVLAFVLALGTAIISMLPFGFPFNLVIFIAFAGLMRWLFLFNSQCQNYLIALKEAYENTAR
jgi:hypothetical protein